MDKIDNLDVQNPLWIFSKTQELFACNFLYELELASTFLNISKRVSLKIETIIKCTGLQELSHRIS